MIFSINTINSDFFSPIQHEHFRGCSCMRSWDGVGQKGPFPKICHTYPQLMKLGTVILYLKKIKKKYMNYVTQTLRSADISVFSPEISKFCSVKKYRYRFHFGTLFLILLTFFGSLKIVLIDMITNSMMSAKMATLVLVKIKVF